MTVIILGQYPIVAGGSYAWNFIHHTNTLAGTQGTAGTGAAAVFASGPATQIDVLASWSGANPMTFDTISISVEADGVVPGV